MNGPTQLIQHLSLAGYHPRSDAHSNAICKGFLDDLLDNCDVIRAKGNSGQLVAQINHTVIHGHERWNIDLAIGPPSEVIEPTPDERMRYASPVVVEIAVEAKGVMTEHGKARHNRLRDFQAFHGHAHRYNSRVIAVGIVVVNISEHFWSPTRGTGDITIHRNIARLGRETVELYRNVPLRNLATDGPGLEAQCVIVVDHDNVAHNPAPPPGVPLSVPSRLVTGAPSPGPGDPLAYSAAVHRVCTAYGDRWGR
jgi:hypothetical protein